MVFSSAIFLFYFLPTFLILYFFTPLRYKNGMALAASILFYFWGAPDFFLILLAAIGIDFWLGWKIYLSTDSIQKRRYLICSLLLNIGLLAYFKYANFFVENVNYLCTKIGIEAFDWIDVALPIGISFFTFQKISYILDIYFNKGKPLKQLTDYALYILLFPQLIAGPIIRFHEIAAQIKDRSAALNMENRINGLFRFSIGLSKKVLIADQLGIEVDRVFNSGLAEIGTGEAWIIIIAYAFQIYFDFSGYSDMAIGIGKTLGFKIPENFNFPYISKSITEFWRRWHITLSNWMKDYLYIPLGGNRKGQTRTYVNLAIVFLLSGLWHGTSWNFVLWGAYHGFFLILDRLFLLKLLRKGGQIISVVFIFVLTLIGWVLFRANTLGEAIIYLERMFSFTPSTLNYSLSFLVIIWISTIFAFLPLFGGNVKKLNKIFETQSTTSLGWKTFICILLLIICMSEITVSNFNPFIYFRF